MNDKLKEIIHTVKLELSKDPSFIVIGKLSDGSENLGVTENNNIQQYNDFLRECNGARCGSIDFWSVELLLKNQYRVLDIPGGENEWLCIGQILYEPLVLNKNDLKVYRFYQGGEDEIQGDCFGDFDYFMLNYVFGVNYLDIMPDAEEDEWFQLLKRLNLV